MISYEHDIKKNNKILGINKSGTIIFRMIRKKTLVEICTLNNFYLRNHKKITCSEKSRFLESAKQMYKGA
jgi:hypothetical protein